MMSSKEKSRSIYFHGNVSSLCLKLSIAFAIQLAIPTVRSSCEDTCRTKAIVVDNTDIKEKIAEHIKHGKDHLINCFDTTGVTDMEGLFFKDNSFNGDISCWDVSNVTDMYVSAFITRLSLISIYNSFFFYNISLHRYSFVYLFSSPIENL